MERLEPRVRVDDRAWQEFLARHPEVGTEAGRLGALFDDVRPECEGFEAPAQTDTSSPATAFRAEMARALFDDLRSEWEGSLARR
jgi:hypothetical protein